MSKDATSISRPLNNADLARVLSPLLFFVAHLVYLALWSPDPFLKKWIDGSFTFFLALVLCNIIRARLAAANAPAAEEPAGQAALLEDEIGDDAGAEDPGPGQRRR
jgi:hypothetical protein